MQAPKYLLPKSAFFFVQVLKGEAIYRYGQQRFTLATGDSISVDAELSHGFIEVLTPKFVFLTVQAEKP